jgi:hypothetical protein
MLFHCVSICSIMYQMKKHVEQELMIICVKVQKRYKNCQNETKKALCGLMHFIQ